MSTDLQQAQFEGYALVEIMGHQRAAGYVTTQAFGSVVMFKVVQQELPAQERTLDRPEWVDGEYLPAGSKVRVDRPRAETMIGAASIYRITPCSEEDAVRRQPARVTILERGTPKAIEPATEPGLEMCPTCEQEFAQCQCGEEEA